MAYVMVISPCYGCGAPISYNPHKVPSIRVNGVREPICKGCVERVNPMRIANGLEPIVPAHDAYEAANESSL